MLVAASVLALSVIGIGATVAALALYPWLQAECCVRNLESELAPKIITSFAIIPISELGFVGSYKLLTQEIHWWQKPDEKKAS